MRPAELDVTYLLEHLDCFATEDDGGDEPYLWVVGFRVDADTIGPPAPGSLVPSLNVQIIPGAPFFAHIVGAGEVHAGRSYPIAPQLGTRSLRLKPARLPGAGWFPGLCGVICLLWDEDGFSPSTSEAGLARFRQVVGPALSVQLNRLLGGAFDEALAKDANGVPMPGWQSMASLAWRLGRLANDDGRRHALKELVREVRGTVSGAIRSALIEAAGLDELIDPDDLLGAEAQVNLGTELSGVLPFELRFTDDDANYRIRGRVFAKRAHQVSLVQHVSDASRVLDRLIGIWQSVCRKPEKLYWAMAYRVDRKVRFELKPTLGPAPASVRWFVDDKPLPAGTSTLPVTFTPPKVFGLAAGNALVQAYPGGAGTLSCTVDGGTLDIVAGGLGRFSGRVRAVYAFPGDPTLFPVPEPSDIRDLIDLGYDTGVDFELETIDVEMSDEFVEDVARCARETIKKYLVQYVPLAWGQPFERPEPPNWHELVLQAQIAALGALQIPTLDTPFADASEVLASARQTCEPR